MHASTTHTCSDNYSVTSDQLRTHVVTTSVTSDQLRTHVVTTSVTSDQLRTHVVTTIVLHPTTHRRHNSVQNYISSVDFIQTFLVDVV